MPTAPTIAVFDSGFGGLTVLRALANVRPSANYLYLGDTARLPYGSKSAETVTRYTDAAVRLFARRGADLVVIACNTASALALPALSASAPLPLVGVIEPGARAAAAAVNGRCQGPAPGPVLVLATEATVRSHAYAHACAAHGVTVHEKACPLLVPLVEEGWTDHRVTAEVAEIYLREALAEMDAGAGSESEGTPRTAADRIPPTAVLLGCTHYPLLRPLLQRTVADTIGDVPLVDSAEATAAYVCSLLPEAAGATIASPQMRFLATDSPAKFQHLGERFLRRNIHHVEVVDLDGPE